MLSMEGTLPRRGVAALGGGQGSLWLKGHTSFNPYRAQKIPVDFLIPSHYYDHTRSGPIWPAPRGSRGGVTDMTNHPNRGSVANYAIVDAHGSFDSAGRGRSYVYKVCGEIDAARRAALKMLQVQIIQGHGLRKGEVVYEDAVGGTYPRIK